MTELKSMNDGLKIQLNNIDSYQTEPGALDSKSFRKKKFGQVPVIRIFGTTESGINLLVHVHGVFPYIYVPYFGEDLSQVDEIIDQLHKSINYNMGTAFRKDLSNDPNFVANITLCKAVDFYGFSVGWQLYLKVYLLNPSYVNKCADLLIKGKICGRVLQPYEAHLPHILQFFADCNLFGCGWLKINECCYRGSLPDDNCDELTQRAKFIPSDDEKMGYAELELDITADLILNRKQLVETGVNGSLKKSSGESLNPDDKTVNSLRELWQEDVKRRRKQNLGPYQDPDEFSQRPPVESKWEREEEHRAAFRKKFFAPEGNLMAKTLHLQSYDSVPTVFQVTNRMFTPQTDSETGAVDVGLGENIAIPDSQGTPPADAEEFETPTNESPFKIKRRRHVMAHDDDTYDNLPTSPTPASKKLSLNPNFYFSQDFDTSLNASRNLLHSFTSTDPQELAAIVNEFDITSEVIYQLAAVPPKNKLLDTFDDYGLPEVIYETPHFKKSKDIPSMPFVHAGVEFRFESHGADQLEDFQFYSEIPLLPNCDSQELLLEYAIPPPSKRLTEAWLASEQVDALQSRQERDRTRKFPSFKDNSANVTTLLDDRLMTVLCLEAHCNSAPDRQPDPEKDPVIAIFWKLDNQDSVKDFSCGVMMNLQLDEVDDISQRVSAVEKRLESCLDSAAIVQVFATESEMMENLILMTRFHDPDVLCGYEINSRSWGYIIERMGVDFANKLSRVNDKGKSKIKDWWGYMSGSAVKVTGRHMLNIWRTLRQEINLSDYTFELVVWEVLHQRVPRYSQDTLCQYQRSDDLKQFEIWAQHYQTRVNRDLQIVQAVELIERHSEQARILGVDYYSVLSRGSQYKVESLLCRISKRENFLLLSPSREQVASQDALSHIPLVMEPESGFYTDPILVLDFQSLYPSVIIAYNLCYSTCLGRVEGDRLGIKSEITLPDGLMHTITEDDVNIQPNGLIYLKPHYRKSTLAKMLEEILDTRVMIKQAMKHQGKDDFRYQRKMNGRQLALKLIANVTYGYVSASFSGRMPCAEIADSIVLTGRETLEKAIKTIHENKSWKAKVVYGDTDSLFVQLPGRSKEHAFQIGHEIANTITMMNPAPVKLKFEKVYLPSVMLTKKRYTGFSYEDVKQEQPFFDAKGTETVRRDGTPALARIEKTALELLFNTKDLSSVKNFLQKEFTNLMLGEVNIDEYCFSKTVKMGSYKSQTLPPAAAIAAKKMAEDPRAEPQYKERVSYLVVAGPQKSRLVDRCLTPEMFMTDPNLNLDAEYYIRKHLIPPLERMFNMIGANISAWYNEMPKYTIGRENGRISNPHKKAGITSLRNYMKSATCAVCRIRPCHDSETAMCLKCSSNKSHSTYVMQSRIKREGSRVLHWEKVCRSCSGIVSGLPITCISDDCPVYYSRTRDISQYNSIASLDW